MKNLFIVLVLATFFSCKKDDVTPPPAVTPDYADSLAGTYIGQEIHYDSDNSTQLYNNGSKTLTIAKLEKNKIQVSTFDMGDVIFTLSSGSDRIYLVPSSPFQSYGSGNNEYFLTSKALYIYVRHTSLYDYEYFSGTKQ